MVSKSFRIYYLLWGLGGGIFGGIVLGWGVLVGCCCCGFVVDFVCLICLEGFKFLGGVLLLVGVGVIEVGVMVKSWIVGGLAAFVGGIGWEFGGKVGGGCCCCWCIC